MCGLRCHGVTRGGTCFLLFCPQWHFTAAAACMMTHCLNSNTLTVPLDSALVIVYPTRNTSPPSRGLPILGVHSPTGTMHAQVHARPRCDRRRAVPPGPRPATVARRLATNSVTYTTVRMRQAAARLSPARGHVLVENSPQASADVAQRCASTPHIDRAVTIPVPVSRKLPAHTMLAYDPPPVHGTLAISHMHGPGVGGWEGGRGRAGSPP